MRLIKPLVFAALLAVGCSSDDPTAEAIARTECERLQSHLVELRMESVTADHDQHRAALHSECNTRLG